MPTLSTIKQSVANEFGKSDYGVPVLKRDIAINDARRQFYTSHKWSFLKVQVQVTFSGGVANYPTYFSEALGAPEVYDVGSTKETYRKVSLEDMNFYDSNDKVWSIDYENNKLVLSKPSETVTVVYWQMPSDYPLDTSADSTVEVAPDVETIIALSKSKYAFASERDEAVRDHWYQTSKQMLADAILRDKRNNPTPNRAKFGEFARQKMAYVTRGNRTNFFQ
jgi:hypothetical protein